MPDTAPTSTPVAGQPDAILTDPTTVETAQQADGQDPAPTPWADPEVARREIERLRREAASWRTKFREAEPIVEATKTDAQRLEDRAGTAERERDELRAQVARLTVAAEFQLPAELLDLLGTGTDEEIRARAQILAERLTPTTAPTPTAPPRVRPVESLTPGAAPAVAETTPNTEAWFRGLVSDARKTCPPKRSDQWPLTRSSRGTPNTTRSFPSRCRPR